MSDAHYIPPSRIREGSELGRAAFGVVVQGFLKEEDGQEKQVSGEAVRALRDSGGDNERAVPSFNRMTDEWLPEVTCSLTRFLQSTLL